MKRTGLLAGLALASIVYAFGDQLEADFTASQTEVCSGSSVIFTDNSLGTNENTLYEWDFGSNATPATATGPGPHTVVYTGSGFSTVSLTLTKGLTDTETKDDYIEIIPVPPDPAVNVYQPSCDNPYGSLEVTSPTDDEEYEYSINNSDWQDSPVFEDLEAGSTYTVYVRFEDSEDNDCYSSTEVSLDSPFPSPPVVEVVAQPDCDVETGSISLTGLPSSGSWTVTQISGGEEISGTGTSTTITDLTAGSYSFTVTDDEGCTSDASQAVEINPQPPTPPAPVAGNIIQPDCGNSTGSVEFTNLPTGEWTLTRLPGDVDITGSGSTGSFPGLPAGTYTFTVTNSPGCTSPPSQDITIDDAPPIPSAPVPESIDQPGCDVSTGNITLTGLPSSGIWNLTRYPGNITTSGTGTNHTISELDPGTYTFTVTNAEGCTSDQSVDIVINPQPSTPEAPSAGNITQPDCETNTGSVALNNLPSGSWTIIRSPGGDDVSGSGSSTTITGLPEGTYSFVVINSAGCSSESTDGITISPPPDKLSRPVPGTLTQPDCEETTGSVILNGLPSGIEWTITRYPGSVSINGTGTSTNFSSLPAGTYTFTVSADNSCTSDESTPVTIDPPPPPPPAPEAANIEHPDCGTATGSITLTNLPSDSWTLVQNPGNIQISGNGSERTITGISPGTYTYTVTNDEGCTSVSSDEITIREQPPSPPAPEVSIVCPDEDNRGMIEITSPLGDNYEYSLNGEDYQSGTTFPDVENGNYRIYVRNVPGCITTGASFSVSCGCSEATLLNLESTSGNTCGRDPFTLNNNSFGGSATQVNISHNGAGTIDQELVQSSPFSFTYTPATQDAGKTIRIIVETNNPLGAPCAMAVEEFLLTVNEIPAVPSVEEIEQPSCLEPTGNITLADLPREGLWTLIRYPDEEITNGTGNNTVITDLPSGTYSFRIEDANSCISGISETVTIIPPPDQPSAPVIESVIQPDCENSFGSVVLDGLPSTGEWIITSYPGGSATEGSGENIVINSLSAGAYYFTVTSEDCVSEPSAEIVINEAPETPSTPVVTEIIQPSCTVPYGSITLNGLPSGGSWTLIGLPDTFRITGNESEVTVTDLEVGTYSFIVVNEMNCSSEESGETVIVASPLTPELVVNNPSPVCYPGTVDLTDPQITSGSTPGLEYSYWEDLQATREFENPETAPEGIYYIKGTNEEGCFDIKELSATILDPPVAEAGPDQDLESVFETQMSAGEPGTGQTGTWAVLTGNGVFTDPNDPEAGVSDLSGGNNLFTWTITSEFCGSDVDTVLIEVISDISAPTLITPNSDGINDNLKFPEIENTGKAQLLIFDRLGAEVFRDDDYNNDWNGVDSDGNDLPADTYFYVLTTENGLTRRSFIVIRR